MSRGPGRIQIKILEFFVDHDCWEEETTKIVKYVQRKNKKPIPTARNIKRAIDGLDMQGWVKKKKDKKSKSREFNYKAYIKMYYDNEDEKYCHTKSIVIRVDYLNGKFINFKNFKELTL